MSNLTVADALQELRSSDCTTALVRDGRDDRGIDGGYLKGGLAINLVSQVYTRARIAVTVNAIETGQNPAIDFRICCWDRETFALLAHTDNLADEINALPRGQVAQNLGGSSVEAEFLDPVSLDAGAKVILGTATYGDFPLRNLNLGSVGLRKCLMGASPQLGFKVMPTTEWSAPHNPSTGGYEGGTPGPISDVVTGNFPFVDLLV